MRASAHKERHMGDSPARAIPVTKISEEYAYLAQQRCACGGRYQLGSQALVRREGRYLDLLTARCRQCGARASWAFDVTERFRPRPHHAA